MSLLSRAKKLITPKKTEKVEKTSEKIEEKIPSDFATRIGLRPLMTEKSLRAQAQSQTAIFQVRREASKPDIARAIQEQYRVAPLAIRTVNMRGKIRRRGNVEGTTSGWKKVYVKVEDIRKLQVAP